MVSFFRKLLSCFIGDRRRRYDLSPPGTPVDDWFSVDVQLLGGEEVCETASPEALQGHLSTAVRCQRSRITAKGKITIAKGNLYVLEGLQLVMILSLVRHTDIIQFPNDLKSFGYVSRNERSGSPVLHMFRILSRNCNVAHVHAAILATHERSAGREICSDLEVPPLPPPHRPSVYPPSLQVHSSSFPPPPIPPNPSSFLPLPPPCSSSTCTLPETDTSAPAIPNAPPPPPVLCLPACEADASFRTPGTAVLSHGHRRHSISDTELQRARNRLHHNDSSHPSVELERRRSGSLSNIFESAFVALREKLVESNSTCSGDSDWG